MELHGVNRYNPQVSTPQQSNQYSIKSPALQKIMLYINIIATKILSVFTGSASELPVERLKNRISHVDAGKFETLTTKLFPKELLVTTRNKVQDSTFDPEKVDYRKMHPDTPLMDIFTLAKKGICAGACREFGEKVQQSLQEKGSISREDVIQLASAYKEGVGEVAVANHILMSYYDSEKTNTYVETYLGDKNLNPEELNFASQMMAFFTSGKVPDLKTLLTKDTFKPVMKDIIDLMKGGKAQPSGLLDIISKHKESLGPSLTSSMEHLVDRYSSRIQWVVKDSKNLQRVDSLSKLQEDKEGFLDGLSGMGPGAYNFSFKTGSGPGGHTTLFINTGESKFFFDPNLGLFELDKNNPKELMQRILKQFYPNHNHLVLNQIKQQ